MIDYKFSLDKINKQEILDLSKKTGLFFETTAILYSRGIDTVEKINYFLDPGKPHFKDPFLLKNMNVAVARIKQAKEEGETVAIYGDYDVDGISATTVLYFALQEFGIEAITVIPERADGYGLQTQILDKLIDESFPTLVITVDCGISCFDEVEYLKNEGIDVIVTDHHELPEKIPDCTVVSCKIPSSYGFDSLCGAGVAYKLAYALIGKKADKYLDFVAIATIADSMPLIGENRDIVFEGIKLIKNGNAHDSIKQLISVSNMREISSTSIAFTIAPRINAAGRMGDAKSALSLMKSTDPELIDKMALKLNSYNGLRQTECEKLYKSARQKLIEQAFDKKIAVLMDDGWNSGLVGIIAAKLVEEFCRPVILFVNSDGKIHGSARSIGDINIFEAISACKEFLTDFGGHAQAAGVSIDIENFDSFCAAIEKYIDERYDYDVFKPQMTVELEINKPFKIELAKELNRLEPFGTGNKKPLFSVKTANAEAQLLKQGSQHLFIKTDYIDMLYFGGANMLDLVDAGTEKEIVFEPNVSIFNHEESLKGYVKHIEFFAKPLDRIKLESFRASLWTVTCNNDDYLYVSDEMTKKVVAESLDAHYGTIFAVYNPDNLTAYNGLDGLDRFLYSTLNKNLLNNIVIGLKDMEISGYRRIVYLDRPLGVVPKVENIKETFIDRSTKAFDYGALSTEKSVFADIFKKAKAAKISAFDSVDYATKCDFGYSKEQVIFALEVFIELGIFYFRGEALRLDEAVRTSLGSSKIYSEVLKLK